jgi:hypothetical protein
MNEDTPTIDVTTDFIPSGPTGPTMYIDTIKFTQDGDSCDTNMTQFLTLRQEDAGAGPYWIMNTDRWAFNDIDELVALLRKAEKARGGRAWRS